MKKQKRVIGGVILALLVISLMIIEVNGASSQASSTQQDSSSAPNRLSGVIQNIIDGISSIFLGGLNSVNLNPNTLAGYEGKAISGKGEIVKIKCDNKGKCYTV